MTKLKVSASKILYIKNWMKAWRIEKYKINDDGSVDINENLEKDSTKFWSEFAREKRDEYSFEKTGGEFPFKIRKSKSIILHCAGLTSLENFPDEVKGNVDVSNNHLINLEDSLKKISGHFYCSYNDKLESLKGAPEYVGCNFVHRTYLKKHDISPEIRKEFIKTLPEFVGGKIELFRFMG